MIVLGIESSCDETAAAVVEDGRRIRSSIVASQTEAHHRYGGVVPEIASRMHVEAIVPVVESACREAGITKDRIEGVAATRGPGLIGALLAGYAFAKAFAWARRIKLAGVNHLEGHICSVLLDDNPPGFPFIALVASGGHTNIYCVTSPDSFELMGQTRDDAAGEAFDKVSKMMGLGYPGGAVIEKLAEKGDPDSIPFPRTYLEKERFDFSFSGIKTAVLRYVTENRAVLDACRADIAAGFQAAVFDMLKEKLFRAAACKGCSRIAVTGGVAANARFLQVLGRQAEKEGMTLFAPPKSLCGDNAAMIAARGHRMLLNGDAAELSHDVFSRDRPG